MANVKLLFCGTDESKTNETQLEVLASTTNEVMFFISDGSYESHVCFDKVTAVRLVRELKKQIGFIDYKEGGNTNG